MSAPFDAERAREDAERCKRIADQRAEERVVALMGADEEEVAFWNRLAGYAEELVRLREGMENLLVGAQPTRDDLTALLAEGQDAEKEAPDA